jgi:hypothetical protein
MKIGLHICPNSKRGYTSRQLIQVANMLEKLFIDLHGNYLSKEEVIMKKLSYSLFL